MADAPPTKATLPSFTLTEYFDFLLRGLTPRSIFANVLALAWILAASALVRWLSRVRRVRANREEDATTQ